MRLLLLLIIGFGLSYAVERHTVIQQDLLASFDDEVPTGVERAFRWFHQNSPLQNRLYLWSPSGTLPAELVARVEAAGYRPDHAAALARAQLTESQMLALTGMLDPAVVRAHLEGIRTEERVESFTSVAVMPGAGTMQQLLRDPLGLAPLLLAAFGGAGPATPAASPPLVFVRDGALDFDLVGSLYRDLAAQPDGVHWIGGDLFAYQNYLAIRRDIMVCSIVSLVLGLLLFAYFCRYYRLLWLLVGGTWLSMVGGIVAVRLVYDEVYAIVLVFASTFVGFNNEYLIHLAGIGKGAWRRAVTGLGSAIGTTAIGFVLLTMAPATISRQFGLLGLGGMISFIAVMLLFRSSTAAVRFREVHVPKVHVGRAGLFVCAGGAALVAAGCFWFTSFNTDINTFRMSTPQLDAQAAVFENLLGEAGMSSVYAYDHLPAEPVGVQQQLIREAGVVRHPALHFAEPEVQTRRASSWAPGYAAKHQAVRQALEAQGIALAPAPAWLAAPEALGYAAYLDLMRTVTGLPWRFHHDGKSYTFIYSKNAQPPAAGLLPMSPKPFYDRLLTSVQTDMQRVFLIGLGVMFLYLLPWQLSVTKVVYIFTPLVMSLAAIALYLALAGRDFNLIHAMGGVLVMALALDYGSVMVSSDHAPQEQSKVLLTGLTGLACFCALLAARHPVMFDLGVTAALGTAVSLAFTMFVRLKPGVVA